MCVCDDCFNTILFRIISLVAFVVLLHTLAPSNLALYRFEINKYSCIAFFCKDALKKNANED